MNFDQLRRYVPELFQIAQKYGILRIFVFGSIARGADSQNDVDFLVEMQEGATLFGAAGFGYESEKLLGIPVDIIPLSILPGICDKEFVLAIQREAIPLWKLS